MECGLVGLIVVNNTVGVEIPTAGHSLSIESYTLPGVPSDDLSILVSTGGEISYPTSSDLTDLTSEVDGLIAEGGTAPETNACKDSKYNLDDYKSSSTYEWRIDLDTIPAGLNVDNTVNQARAAIQNVTLARNDCGRGDFVSASSLYQGDLDAASSVQSDGTSRNYCTSPDSESLVSFGDLKPSTLAAMCPWKWDSGVFGEPLELLAADVKVNKNDFLWTLWGSSTACDGKYDLQATMTHEIWARVRAGTCGGDVPPESHHEHQVERSMPGFGANPGLGRPQGIRGPLLMRGMEMGRTLLQVVLVAGLGAGIATSWAVTVAGSPREGTDSVAVGGDIDRPFMARGRCTGGARWTLRIRPVSHHPQLTMEGELVITGAEPGEEWWGTTEVKHRLDRHGHWSFLIEDWTMRADENGRVEPGGWGAIGPYRKYVTETAAAKGKTCWAKASARY